MPEIAATISAQATKLKDHSIRMTDINNTTRRDLRGRRGRPGPQGPAGARAATYWAVVAPYGLVVRGDADGGHDLTTGSGHYILRFPKTLPANISGCAYTPTIGSIDTAQPPGGFATAWNDGATTVHVQTYNASGAPTDMPFHITVNC